MLCLVTYHVDEPHNSSAVVYMYVYSCARQIWYRGYGFLQLFLRLCRSMRMRPLKFPITLCISPIRMVFFLNILCYHISLCTSSFSKCPFSDTLYYHTPCVYIVSTWIYPEDIYQRFDCLLVHEIYFWLVSPGVPEADILVRQFFLWAYEYVWPQRYWQEPMVIGCFQDTVSSMPHWRFFLPIGTLNNTILLDCRCSQLGYNGMMTRTVWDNNRHCGCFLFK